MNKQKSVTARRMIFALILAGFIAIPVTRLRAQSSESISSDEALSIETLSQEDLREVSAQIKQARGQRLEGSWVVTVTPVVPPGVPQPPSFRAYASFARGGASVGSGRTTPLGSPQHGTWEHIRGDEFASTAIQDLFDVMGNFQGTLTVRVKSTLIGKDEFVGVSNGETRDAAGNLISSRCATVRGQRIKIEPLAPQCQSIPLPQ
jgi:hypothetical protein